jgi:hypothetical protein
LYDAWAKEVNDSFVRQTRLDPSHDAVVEQGLYNRLPDWLVRMERGEDVVAELDVGEHRYRAELSADAFIEAAEPFYRALTERIRQAGVERLVLRHRLVGLPGLAQRMADVGHAEPHWLDQQAVVRTALGLAPAASAADDGAVPLVLELRIREADDLAARPGSAAGLPSSGLDHPTHVLVDGNARAIDASGRNLTEHWRIERDADGRVVLVGADVPDRMPVTINGRPALSGAALDSGDRVDAGGREFVLLRVTDRAAADNGGDEERGSA